MVFGIVLVLHFLKDTSRGFSVESIVFEAGIVKATSGAGCPFDFEKIMGSSLVVVDGS